MSFTVVITTYNRQHCVVNAVKSALAIKGCEEVIVVDDASFDDTLIILNREFSCAIDAARLILVSNSNNLGVTGAKNVGYSMARCEWVIFLDSDDWFVENIDRQILAEFNLYSNAPIIFFRCTDQNGKFVGVRFEQSQLIDLPTYLQNTSFGEALTAINKKLVQNEPYVTELRGYEGLGCCRLIAEFGPAVLSSVVARVYDQGGNDRLSINSGMFKRMPLLAKGHWLLLKEFHGSMKNHKIVSYLFKIVIYYVIGNMYMLKIRLHKRK
jgi:glycosyltransferase involved in cell wall biosynthesis